MRAVALLLTCLALPLESWGEIYLWADEQGRAVYSEAADSPTLPTFSPPPAPGKSTRTRQPEEPATYPYTALVIVQPGNDETIHDNSGTLEVALTLSPPLQTEQDHRIKIFLDGKALPNTRTTTSFTVTEIDRGGHTLQVAVVDRSGQLLITSGPTTFFMWRASILFSPH